MASKTFTLRAIANAGVGTIVFIWVVFAISMLTSTGVQKPGDPTNIALVFGILTVLMLSFASVGRVTIDWDNDLVVVQKSIWYFIAPRWLRSTYPLSQLSCAYLYNQCSSMGIFSKSSPMLKFHSLPDVNIYLVGEANDFGGYMRVFVDEINDELRANGREVPLLES